LDKYLHPHVYHDSHNLSTYTYLEQALDVVYADKYFSIDATRIVREKELFGLMTDLDELYDFHKHMAASVYEGYLLPKRGYDRAYWWWSRVARLTDQPSKWRRCWLKIYNVFLPFDIVAFIYKPKEQVQDQYDFEKHFNYIEKANNESLSYMKMVYDFARGKHDRSVLISTFYNINCLGKPIIPWKERKSFRKAYRNAPTIK
jgi:hypothetical protein